MKTEVYSWRLSADRKLELEAEARQEGKSVSQLLEEISASWLAERRGSRSGNNEEQAALKRRIMKTVGTLRGGDPTRSTRSKQLVRDVIRRKYEKELNASGRTD